MTTATWVTPKRAALMLCQQNPDTLIKEKTIRVLIGQGFPCIKLTSRQLVNMETFDDDLVEFSKQQTAERNNANKAPKIVNGIRKIKI